MRKLIFWIGVLGILGSRGPLLAQESFPLSRPSALLKPSAALNPWRVIKEKSYPFYKVQILTQDDPDSPLGIAGTQALIIDLSGKTVAEAKNLLIEPDPRVTLEGWIPGTLLDVDHDGYEDLVLRIFTGGAHCCYSYQIYSLGKGLKRLGDLRLLDCGEKIKLQDLNHDNLWEILTCNASFTYFKGIPYSESPFPPKVFGLEGGRYVNQDRKYPPIFDEDIAGEKKRLQEKGYSHGDVLQIVLDYFLSGREAQGWVEFDQLFNAPAKERVRGELKEKWDRYQGIRPETKTAEKKPLMLP